MFVVRLGQEKQDGFMTNCLKPFAITFAGFVVDYKLAITLRNNLQANLRQFVQFMFLQMFRTACSYALVFYNLQKDA
jgi:hypothetical protein